jgi:hypothetical protein
MQKVVFFATLAIVAVLPWGCAPSTQGMKIRAQSPSIEEAYRKMTIALTVDDYAVAGASPDKFQASSDWRDAKEKEMTKEEKTLPPGSVQCRVDFRMERRGMLYDIFLTPHLRRRSPGGTWDESVAAATHPLYDKWQQIIGTLVRKEAREED